ncbi:YchJ family protein [Schaalia vaccimaxillae]|uniref:YchJ family protein n=1 Tax=Schaalia vaccimaxillae TaxID=183916 RepID=UPI0003B50E86|nr:YchJ family metal-binding protein [Schaalia vaccimaxillae]
MTECPCGSELTLAQCCGPFLDGEPAPTAEALMRSRYSAFATGNEDHLFRSWHPRTRPAAPFVSPVTQWLGLRIIKVDGGGPEDEHGLVEFEARWCDNLSGQIATMRERSQFEKRAGRWVYVSGEVDNTGGQHNTVSHRATVEGI